MNNNEATRAASLAMLIPSQAMETHYRAHRDSLRLHGSHYMVLKRPSRMPESAREYVPGDPINAIDWRAFARTDHLLIREIRDEATARVRIGIDLSESMRWPDASVSKNDVVQKSEIALRVGLHLAALHLRMGDLVEVWIYHNDRQKIPEQKITPKVVSDLEALFWRLHAGAYSVEAILREFSPASYFSRKCDTVFWVGDCLGQAEFNGFLRMGTRSFLWHVLSPLELSIEWMGSHVSYYDDRMIKKEYQGSVLKSQDRYLTQIRGWCQRLEHAQKQHGGNYSTITDATAISVFHKTLIDHLKVDQRLQNGIIGRGGG